jgi:hypothetical protein
MCALCGADLANSLAGAWQGSSLVVIVGLPALHAAYLELRQQHITPRHVGQFRPGLSWNLGMTPACSASRQCAEPVTDRILYFA